MHVCRWLPVGNEGGNFGAEVAQVCKHQGEGLNLRAPSSAKQPPGALAPAGIQNIADRLETLISLSNPILFPSRDNCYLQLVFIIICMFLYFYIKTYSIVLHILNFPYDRKRIHLKKKKKGS